MSIALDKGSKIKELRYRRRRVAEGVTRDEYGRHPGLRERGMNGCVEEKMRRPTSLRLNAVIRHPAHKLLPEYKEWLAT